MVGLSLAPKSRGARIRECVYVGLVGGGVGGWGWGGWLCGPVVHVPGPLGGSTEGAQILRSRTHDLRIPQPWHHLRAAAAAAAHRDLGP